MDSQLTPITRAALWLPRHQITGAAPMATVLLWYPVAPRVFTEPDALTRRAFDLGWEVVLDGDLSAVDDPAAPAMDWRRHGSTGRRISVAKAPVASGGGRADTQVRHRPEARIRRRLTMLVDVRVGARQR